MLVRIPLYASAEGDRGCAVADQARQAAPRRAARPGARGTTPSTRRPRIARTSSGVRTRASRPSAASAAPVPRAQPTTSAIASVRSTRGWTGLPVRVRRFDGLGVDAAEVAAELHPLELVDDGVEQRLQACPGCREGLLRRQVRGHPPRLLEVDLDLPRNFRTRMPRPTRGSARSSRGAGGPRARRRGRRAARPSRPETRRSAPEAP